MKGKLVSSSVSVVGTLPSSLVACLLLVPDNARGRCGEPVPALPFRRLVLSLPRFPGSLLSCFCQGTRNSLAGQRWASQMQVPVGAGMGAVIGQ